MIFILGTMTACATVNSPSHTSIKSAHDSASPIQSVANTASSTSGNNNDSASAAPPGMDDEDDEHDPFESFNRKVYNFNDHFDKAIAKPVAKAYVHVTPAPVRKGLSNFFRNLFQPAVVVNSALQGKFKQSATGLTRFLVNSTLGLLGTVDVASEVGLEAQDADFGQTLGIWGVPEGPFLVVPFFGPRDTRDAFGMVVDWYSDPVTYISPTAARYETKALEFTDIRAQYLGASSVLEQATDDPYIFVREAYRQKRRSLVGRSNSSAEPDFGSAPP